MDIDKIAETIDKGGIVVMPTDTVYGIIGDALSIEVVDKIYKLKKRDYSKALVILVSSIDMLNKYCYNVTELEEKIINTYSPGELTIILKKRKILPDIVTGGMDSVAVRIPNDNNMLAIINKLGRAVVATSANISSKEVITNVDLLEDSIKENVNYIYDGGYINNITSTIVRVNNNKIFILRDGKLANDIRKRFSEYIND